jgi:uncharacterized protein DUF397
MRSSLCPDHPCVDVEYDTATSEFVVTDTKNEGKGPELRFTEEEWEAFLGGCDLGEFTKERLAGRPSPS